MKTIVTHYRPHLDDICAAWLLKRFHPDFADAEIGFMATGPKGNPEPDTEERVHVGVGRTRFDEHKGDEGQCAASLVLDYIKKEGAVDKDAGPALDKIVAWVLLEDTGQLASIEQRDFSVPVILKGEYDRTKRDSHAVADLGFRILDALLPAQKGQVLLERDWTNRIEFKSRFGPGVAMKSGASNADTYAYRQGFVIIANINESGRYHSIRADAKTDIDLTSVYEKLLELEPKSGWYFHHGKQMVICGGDLAPDVKPSALTLPEMVELLK